MAPAPKAKPVASKPEEAKDQTEKAEGDAPGDEADAATPAAEPAADEPPAPAKEPTKAVKKKRGKKGTVYTMAHPPAWDMSDLFKALQKHQVKAVHDARPNPEAGPAAEALRVAFSSGNIAYEREPALSSFYTKLLDQARGESDEGSKPCVLLDGRVAWRLQQYRRCLSQYLKTKGLDVRHLLWSGEIDHEATAKADEEVKREVVQKPDPPRFPVPKVMVKTPMPMAPTSKAPSMAPTTKAIGLGPVGMTPPTSKAGGITPPTSKAVAPTLPLKATAKASASFSSADASPKAAAGEMLKAKPKAASSASEESANIMKPKPKGGGTPAPKADDEPEAKKQKTEEPKAEAKQPTVTKKWAKKADAS